MCRAPYDSRPLRPCPRPRPGTPACLHGDDGVGGAVQREHVRLPGGRGGGEARRGGRASRGGAQELRALLRLGLLPPPPRRLQTRVALAPAARSSPT
jgi:hypothetical protein